MLWTILVILLVLWLLGFLGHVGGGDLGRFATLLEVVNHYNSFKGLNLTDREKRDLVEYLKSL